MTVRASGQGGKRSPEEARGKKRNGRDRQARYKLLVQRRRAITTKVHERRKEEDDSREIKPEMP